MTWDQVIREEAMWNSPLINDMIFLIQEALTRFLKAKLRVMQEEIDRLCHELTNKVC